VAVKRAAVVFVHGLFSSPGTWSHFDKLISADSALSNLTILHFEYSSPKFNFNPLRQIPDFDVIADNLRTYLEIDAAEYSDLILVSHSQGGLIIQRFLARMVTDARGLELERIRRVILFACPNSGSQIFMLARKRFMIWRNPQERALRPINELVSGAEKIVINRIVHAEGPSTDSYPIKIIAYAGESDNIVTPTSAKGVFPDTGVIPGDHFSIIQPDSSTHRSYTTLRTNILTAFKEATSQGGRSEAHNSGTDSARQTSQGALPETAEDSQVIVRVTTSAATVDFIASPKVALQWIRELGQGEGSGDATQRP
jgi:pimeloyl-ACP methyl ester carboxylesterase